VSQGKPIPNTYWVKVMHTTIYLVNRSSTRGVIRVAHEEVWFGRIPKVSHLKIFGLVAYALDENRSKFIATSRRFLFVGYSNQGKAYMLLDPCTNQLVARKDVKIDESSDLNQSISATMMDDHCWLELLVQTWLNSMLMRKKLRMSRRKQLWLLK